MTSVHQALRWLTLDTQCQERKETHASQEIDPAPTALIVQGDGGFVDGGHDGSGNVEARRRRGDLSGLHKTILCNRVYCV